jgi:hypothetical protein
MLSRSALIPNRLNTRQMLTCESGWAFQLGNTTTAGFPPPLSAPSLLWFRAGNQRA